MMGTKIRSFAPLPKDVSLEDLLPEENFYPRLQAPLDGEQRAPGAGVAQVGLQEDGGSQGEHHRPRRLPHAPEEGRKQTRLADPLPRGRG
jgi:hypothetical protein